MLSNFQVFLVKLWGLSMFFVTFRMDDITPTMDWSKFNVFCEIFDRYDLCPLLSVIPDNRDEFLYIEHGNDLFWERIRILKRKGYAIGQHGYQHVYCTSNSGMLGINKYSEFAGLTYEEQYEKIWRGKNILQKQCLDSNIWVAPAHSYDRNTLVALRNNNFEVVSDGCALFPYVKMGLKFVPCQLAVPRFLMKMGVYTVDIHSNFASLDFLHKLEKFICNNRGICINYQEALAIEPYDCVFNSFVERGVLLMKKAKFFLARV